MIDDVTHTSETTQQDNYLQLHNSSQQQMIEMGLCCELSVRTWRGRVQITQICLLRSYDDFFEWESTTLNESIESCSYCSAAEGGPLSSASYKHRSGWFFALSWAESIIGNSCLVMSCHLTCRARACVHASNVSHTCPPRVMPVTWLSCLSLCTVIKPDGAGGDNNGCKCNGFFIKFFFVFAIDYVLFYIY